jgi:hypothetical protein
MKPRHRNRGWAPAAWLGAVLLAASAGGQAGEGPATNLIPNGDFEAPSAADPALPRAWTPHASGKVTATWAGDGAHSGKRCLEMVTDPGEKEGHAYWTSDPISVTPCMAYRVAFYFKAKAHGVPVFSLSKVKEWRLAAGDTEGKWVAHEDVVVIPPDVTATFFSVNNYHRPGKSMWLDDVSLVELPLSQSPLTQRLVKARAAVQALGRNVSRLALTAEQKTALAELQADLADAEKGYARLQAGKATAEDFQGISAGLDGVEKAIGTWALTAWVMSPDQRLSGQDGPTALMQHPQVTLALPAEGKIRCCFGVMNLVGEGLPARVTLVMDSRSRNWRARLRAAPASSPLAPAGEGDAPDAWAEMNRLGEIFLLPGAPRYLLLELEPDKPKPGTYEFTINVDLLDRPAATLPITVRVEVGRAGAG